MSNGGEGIDKKAVQARDELALIISQQNAWQTKWGTTFDPGGQMKEIKAFSITLLDELSSRC